MQKSSIRSLIAPIIFTVVIGSLLGYIKVRASAPLPDPNDPSDVGLMDPLVLSRNLKWASDFVNERVRLKDVSDKEGKRLISEYASSLVAQIDSKAVPDFQAWEYAEFFRTAQQWERAGELFERAVATAKKSKNEDRRVVDSIRYAHVLAMLGQTQKAIELVRSTFDSPPENKGSILLGTYMEIVPAAKGKGLDLELAKLIEDAILQHEQAKVSPNTDEGLQFLAVRGYHRNQAMQLARELYRAAGREDLAQSVAERMR